MLNILNFIFLAANDDRSAVNTYPVPTVSLGFAVPTFAQVLTFLIRLFFVIAGIVALLYLLLGAFGWITSGGNKEAVDKAREKIQAALIGLILIFAVLAIVTVMENILSIGLGISKPIEFPQLIQRTN